MIRPLQVTVLASWALILLTPTHALSEEVKPTAETRPDTSVSSTKNEAAPDDVSTEEESHPEKELAPPRANTTVIGPNPSYIGQLVELEIQLLRESSGPTDQAVFFPELRVPGAITNAASSAPPPELRTVDEIEYLVQKRRYLVFPQEIGTISVPAMRLVVPGESDAPPQDISTQPVSLQADAPRGAGDRLPLIARNVSLKRTIDGHLDQLRVGETFTVSLRLVADDTDPIMLPQLELPELTGHSRYLGQPSTRSSSERGSYHAERVDQATYVARDWGFARLPRTSVFWLDPATGTYNEASVPALSFRVRVNPKLGTSCVGRPETAVKLGGATGFLALLGLWLLRLTRRISQERKKRALVAPSEDERKAFLTLRRAANGGEPGATLTALYRWMRYAAGSPLTLAGLRQQTNDPELNTSTSQLEQDVASGAHQGKTASILPSIDRLRRASHPKSEAQQLPRLN